MLLYTESTVSRMRVSLDWTDATTGGPPNSSATYA